MFAKELNKHVSWPFFEVGRLCQSCPRQAVRRVAAAESVVRRNRTFFATFIPLSHEIFLSPREPPAKHDRPTRNTPRAAIPMLVLILCQTQQTCFEDCMERALSLCSYKKVFWGGIAWNGLDRHLCQERAMSVYRLVTVRVAPSQQKLRDKLRSCRDYRGAERRKLDYIRQVRIPPEVICVRTSHSWHPATETSRAFWPENCFIASLDDTRQIPNVTNFSRHLTQGKTLVNTCVRTRTRSSTFHCPWKVLILSCQPSRTLQVRTLVMEDKSTGEHFPFTQLTFCPMQVTYEVSLSPHA